VEWLKEKKREREREERQRDCRGIGGQYFLPRHHRDSVRWPTQAQRLEPHREEGKKGLLSQ